MNFDYNKIFEWVGNLPAAPMTVLLTLLVGFTIKKSRTIDNQWIPFITVPFGAVCYTALSYGFGRFAVEGIVYSSAAWLFHRFIWKSIAAKLGIAVTDDSNPRAFVKETPPKGTP